MNYAIILAAGKSERFGTDKLLTEVAGRPLIYYSISSMNDHHLIDTIVVVVNKSNQKAIEEIIERYKFSKIKRLVIGGKTRLESLEKGLSSLKKPEPAPQDLIVVHNAANPLPSYEEITKTIMSAEEKGAAIVVHKVTATVKKAKGKNVEKTISRENLYTAETPQVAQYGVFKKALLKAKKSSQKIQQEITDESMLFESIGQKVIIEEAHENNIKVTTEKDLEAIRTALGETPSSYLVGIGQDSHEFEKTKKGLTLAGVFFADQLKLEANSDGDVIIHAVFNALSQAIGDKSLGFYADKMCADKGITDSKKYLEPLLKKLKTEKLTIQNLGIMLECKIPKIDKINPLLKQSLAKILSMDAKRIGITATSGENLTAFGQGLGIQCFAIVSLAKNQQTKKK